MSRPRKIRILLDSVLVLVVGINLYFQYQSHQERFQLKASFEEQDNIAVLQHLTDSEKYAPDMRKAGYVIPPDGAIRLDGGIDSIGIKGDIDLKMLNLQIFLAFFSPNFLFFLHEKLFAANIRAFRLCFVRKFFIVSAKADSKSTSEKSFFTRFVNKPHTIK